MPPGVASVVVQVLTGDADAKLKHLGDTAVAQAKAMESAYAKTGAVMSASFEESASAVDVALLSNKKYQESLVQMERAKLQLWNTTLKTAADMEVAEARVTATLKEQERVQKEVGLNASAAAQARKAAADVAVRESERELEAAKRAARIVPAQRGTYEKAVGSTIVAKAGATRDIEGQIAAQKKLEEAAGKQAAALQGVQRFGGKALLGVGVAATVAGVEALKMGIDFENGQKKFEAFSGQGERAGKALTSAFEGTAGRFKQSGQELESSYAGVSRQVQMTQGHVLGAGESLKFMSAASNLTTASGEKLGNITKDLASVMQVYKVKLGDAADTSNKLYNASRTVSTSVDSMTSLVTKLHARLGDIGGGLSSVLGLMTEASSFGLTGGRGVLIFNQALERLTSDSKSTTGVLEHLNVHLHNSKNEFVGLPSVIEQLHGAYQKLTPAQREFATQQLFGKGATGEFTEIIRNGKSGLEQFTHATNTHGEVERAAQKQMESFTEQLEVMWAAVRTTGGALGKSLIPELKDVTGAMKSSAEWLSHNSGAALALAGVLATGLGATMGAFVAGKVALMVNGLKAAGGAFVGLVTSATTAEVGVVGAATETEAGVDAALLGTGLGAIVVAAGLGVLALKDHWSEAGKGMEEAAQSMANFVIDRLNEMIEGVNEFTNKISLGLIPAIEKLHHFSGAGEGGGGASAEPPPTPGFSSFGTKGEKDKEGGLMGAFESEGFSGVAAAGIVGNFRQESSLNPTLNNKEGTGLASWIGSRKGALEKFAHEHHEPVLSAGTQIQFALKEIKERGLTGKLNAAKTPQEAAQIFEKLFEGAGQPEMQKREEYAAEALGTHPQTKAHEEELRSKHFHESSGPGNAGIQAEIEEHKHGKAKKKTAALGIPPAIAAMLSTAEHLIGSPYTWGGGHGSSADDPVAILKKIGVDCSGFVSRVVSSGIPKAAGFGTAEIASSPLYAKGAGKYVTVMDRSGGGDPHQEHTLIDIMGKYFEEGGKAASKAAKQITKKQWEEEIAGGGFQAYHPGAFNAPVKGGLNASALGGNPALLAEAKAAESIQKAGTGLFRKYEDAIQNGTVRSLDKLTGVTEKDPTGAHSVQFAELSVIIAGLKASGLNELASKLATVHREALETLNTQLEANAQEKEAAELKSSVKHNQDELSIANTASEKTLEIRKDEAEKSNHAIQAAAQALGDASAVLRSKSDAAIQALQDAAQVMSDEFAGRTSAVKDAGQVKVDELNERGKYGLDLQAQREQVALDQMKQQYDAQLDQMRLTLDQTKTLEDSLVAQKSIDLTTITARENAAVAARQASVDAEKIAVEQLDAKVQAKVGQVQLHADDRVSQDILKQVVATLKGASKTAQSELAARTKWDEEFGAAQVSGETSQLAAVERSGRAKVQTAEEALAGAQTSAAKAVALAQGQLAEAEATSKEVIAKGQAGMTGLSGEAELSESEAQRKIDETKARASTQYAGSGLVVNFTNIPPNDAAAIQSELGFLMRTRLPA